MYIKSGHCVAKSNEIVYELGGKELSENLIEPEPQGYSKEVVPLPTKNKIKSTKMFLQ